MALLLTAQTEELGAVSRGESLCYTEDVLPCSRELIDQFWRDSLCLTKRELIGFLHQAAGHEVGLYIGVVGIAVVTVMATHQLIDDVERTDGIPSVGSLAELAGHIGHVDLGKLFVQIDVHLMLCRSQFCIHAVVVARIDRTKDSLLQSLSRVRHVRTLYEGTLGIDASQVFLNSVVETIIATLVAQLYIVNNPHTADDGAGVENLVELRGYDGVELLLGPFLKLLTGVGILIAGGGSSHIAVHLTVPVEGILQFLVLSELRADIVNQFVRDVAECQLLRAVVVVIYGKFYYYIGRVAEELTLLDTGSNGKGTSKILLLVAQTAEILEEDFTQHLGLSIVVHALTLDELCHLHFLLAVEGVGFEGAVLAWFTTDDVIVAEIVQNFFYLILNSKTWGIDVVH